MPCFKLTVSYDGTRFNGFQRQVSNQQFHCPKRPKLEGGRKKNVAFTIQECVERALLFDAKHTPAELNITFAGRTDKGVHARGQVVVARLDDNLNAFRESENRLDRNRSLLRAINSRLPCDISIDHVEECPPILNARHHVVLKTYSYTLKFGRGGPQNIRNAWDSPCLWLCPWFLDVQVLEETLQKLQGEHDFRVFCHKSVRSIDRSHVILMKEASLAIESKNNVNCCVKFKFTAKGFRRSMVRNMVGFCVDVARGLYSIEDFGGWETVWSGTEAVATKVNAAPASGLCLECVNYPHNDELQAIKKVNHSHEKCSDET